MSNFVLSEIEIACGVSLLDVTKHAGMAWIGSDCMVMVERGLSPALSGAVARFKLGAQRVEFVKLWSGQPIYRVAKNVEV